MKRFKTCDNFTQTAQLKSTVAEKLKCMTVGIESMVIDFVTEYGSHYIDEYVLGDTIFQVNLSRMQIIRVKIKLRKFNKKK